MGLFDVSRAPLFRRRIQAAGFASRTRLTFCIAHFNGSEFLEVALDAIRRHHPESRVVVADSRSMPSHRRAAKAACKKFAAEWHPLLFKHNHTGLLNFLYRQIQTDRGVFLDQDCVLLESLEPLARRMSAEILLAGPRDEMQLTHPRIQRRHPALHGKKFRFHADFVHASLMMVNVRELKPWAGQNPFRWDAAFGPQPLERYYGLTERIRRNAANGILFLDSQHTSYGLGMAYLFEKKPIAYHNWYSGRIHGQAGMADSLFEMEWLRAETSRFIHDYWAGTVKLELPQSGHSPADFSRGISTAK